MNFMRSGCEALQVKGARTLLEEEQIMAKKKSKIQKTEASGPISLKDSWGIFSSLLI